MVQERYAPELKYDIALRLAALHIHQHAMVNNIPYCKVTVKAIEYVQIIGYFPEYSTHPYSYIMQSIPM